MGSSSELEELGEAKYTHRPLSSSFLWFIFCFLQGSPKQELLKGLWVVTECFCPPTVDLWFFLPGSTYERLNNRRQGFLIINGCWGNRCVGFHDFTQTSWSPRGSARYCI